MTRAVAAAGYAALVVAVLVAPSLVLDDATARGGAARGPGFDLVVVSALIGVAYAGAMLRSLARHGRDGERAADWWLSALHGLLVLALAASALPAAVLHTTSPLHARVVDAEWPVLLAWAAVLAVAMVMAEGARRWSLRWLAAENRRDAPAGPSRSRGRADARSQGPPSVLG